jgi:hypothetical protein
MFYNNINKKYKIININLIVGGTPIESEIEENDNEEDEDIIPFNKTKIKQDEIIGIDNLSENLGDEINSLEKEVDDNEIILFNDAEIKQNEIKQNEMMHIDNLSEIEEEIKSINKNVDD